MEKASVAQRMKQKDILVHSWGELMEALYDLPRNRHGRHRSNFVYRGVADSSWHLDTSLSRLGGDFEMLERPLLRSFRKYAEPGALLKEGVWIELAIAQHHGLPTRLLDWTISPRVAAHFATEKHYERDSAIWCVDISAVHRMLPASLGEKLISEYAFLFSVEMLDQLEDSQTLESFDKLAAADDFAVFFEPPSLDARIVNQAAILSAMPGPGLDLTEFLICHPDVYKRILIPADLKWEVRDKLDQDSVNERTLFPGLDGLCDWLKRYYGPGPGS